MSVMRRGLIIVFVLGITRPSAAQDPAPGGWNLSPSLSGASVADAFTIHVTPAGTMIFWEPFGKVAENWGPVAVLRDGSIEFHRAGDATASCQLQRVDERTYTGTCRGFSANPREVTFTRNQSSERVWLPVSDADFRILARTREILSGPSAWNHKGDRICEDDQKAHSWSLFCAISQASIDVTGTPPANGGVVMDVRAGTGVMKAFNNRESTTYADVMRKLDEAEKRLRARQQCSQTEDWKEFADGTYVWPRPQEPAAGRVIIFGETIAEVVVQKNSYELLVTADRLAPVGQPPDRWLAESTAVTTTAHKAQGGSLDGVNVTGTLRNGNVWRSLSQCGQSLRYYDVPAEAAAALDRLIDTVYTHGR